MPEPFKNIYNPKLIAGIAEHLARASSVFDRAAFEIHALNGLEDLEMMDRAEQISRAIDTAFPDDFAVKSAAILAALHPREDMKLKEMVIDVRGIAGWAVAAMARVIARDGLEHPVEALAVLKEMTKRFSAEFSVRPFFRDHLELTLETAMNWAEDENVHVRRLASEGARPVLPWGIKLQTFVEDPEPLIPLLTKLRDDPEEYVRKSVANNLNDISKTHPDLVTDLAKDWLKDANTARKRLAKRACRGLIKQGHTRALDAFGFSPPDLRGVSLQIPSKVTLGETLEIVLSFTAKSDQALLIDYVLHFMRANGNLSPKVFKWTEVTAVADEKMRLKKSHAYKPVTTRKDYPGAQILSVQINGEEIARQFFDFSL